MNSPCSCRQAATPVGVEKRLDDMGFERVHDPRDPARVVHRLPPLLKLIVIAIMSNAGSSHGVQRRSHELKPRRRQALGDLSTVADNTVSTLLPRLSGYQLRRCNVDYVKREKRRGRLQPTGGLNFHVVAVDGKCIAIWRWHDLLRLTRKGWKALHQDKPSSVIAPPFEAEDRQPNLFEVYCFFKTYFHNVQLVFPKDGLPYGRLMVHRATLVSTRAAVGLLQRPIGGHTNEVGTIGKTLCSLLLEYGATDLCAMFVMDAGNTCLEAANLIVGRKRDYYLRLKGNQQSLHDHAIASLGDGQQEVRRPDLVVVEKRGGKDVYYRLWQKALPKGFGDWSHARQLVRVERLVVGDEPGEVSMGQRYYVSSKDVHELKASVALRLSRVYWRCENEEHWTADAILKEDTLRGRLSRHPVGVVVASWLRLMAQNVLAVLRSLSRVDRKGTRPCWQEVLEYVRENYFRCRIDTSLFDAVGV